MYTNQGNQEPYAQPREEDHVQRRVGRGLEGSPQGLRVRAPDVQLAAVAVHTAHQAQACAHAARAQRRWLRGGGAAEGRQLQQQRVREREAGGVQVGTQACGKTEREGMGRAVLCWDAFRAPCRLCTHTG